MNNHHAIPWPDLTGRPHAHVVERAMLASPTAIFRAWTVHCDRWLSLPGRALMKAEVGEPFYFETQFNGRRYPHYGRFLVLEPDRRIVMTWVTGPNGTHGVETVLSIELTATGTGTHCRLAHAGFLTAAASLEHEHAWHVVLRNLDSILADEPVPEEKESP
ncbi:MAG TPA: SRPBCC family protein [Sporichthyaceae bacterium]